MAFRFMDPNSLDMSDDEEMEYERTEPTSIMISGNNAIKPSTFAQDTLAKSIVVTNVDPALYQSAPAKAEFEHLFGAFGGSPRFHYFKSFKRVRVDYDQHGCANRARREMDDAFILGTPIHCFLLQVGTPQSVADQLLEVPPLEKQFLISPPASPPLGWVQPKEDKPVVNTDLMTAIAQLEPGTKHELHPPNQVNLMGKSISTPSIVVHVADHAKYQPKTGKIMQTRCPQRQHSLE